MHILMKKAQKAQTVEHSAYNAMVMGLIPNVM